VKLLAIWRRSNIFERIALFGGSILILIGIAGLVGLTIYAQSLTGFSDNYIPTSEGTCFNFLLQGIIIIWYINSRTTSHNIPLIILASTSIAYGLLSFMGFFSHVDHIFGNNILFTDKYLSSFSTKVMSPLTGVIICLSGSALALLTIRRVAKKRFVMLLIESMAGLTAMAGLSGAVSYVYGAPFLYGSEIIPASLMTYIGFMFLGAALLGAAGPDGFLLSSLRGASVEAVLLRTFIPLAFIAVITSDILQHVVTKYNSAIVSGGSVVFFAMGSVVLVVHVARRIGGTIDAAEEARRRAEESIVRQNVFFETVLESLPYPFYVIDANDYTVIMANSSATSGGLPPNITCHELTH
jgi:PAS domain-containing protein